MRWVLCLLCLVFMACGSEKGSEEVCGTYDNGGKELLESCDTTCSDQERGCYWKCLGGENKGRRIMACHLCIRRGKADNDLDSCVEFMEVPH